MSVVLTTSLAVLTATVATIGWWKQRRALIAERAARRLSAVFQQREHAADLAAQQDAAIQTLRINLAAELVVAEAERIVDHAYTQTTSSTLREGDDDA